MPGSLLDAVKDPEFHTFSQDQQHAIAAGIDPAFDTFSPTQKNTILFKLDPSSFYSAKEKQYGLPANLLGAISHIESTENPAAKNPARTGGRGLMQFVRSTGKLYGITDQNWQDPIAQLDAAGRYFQEKRFGGDVTKFLTEYGGVNSPKGDKHYVQKVMDRINFLGGKGKTLTPLGGGEMVGPEEQGAPEGPASSTTMTATTTPQPVGQAVWDTLTRGRQEAERRLAQASAAVQNLGQGAREGESGQLSALKRSGETILDTLGAAPLPPASAALSAGSEVASRAGVPGFRQLSPEDAATAGAVVPAVAALAPAAARGGARLLSPTLRRLEAAERADAAAQASLAARRGEQAGAKLANAQQMEARPVAGQLAQETAQGISDRLLTQAGKAQEAVAAHPESALKPTAGTPARRLQTASPGGPSLTTEVPAVPAKTLTTSSFSPEFKTLQESRDRFAQQVVDYNRWLDKIHPAKIGPAKASRSLGRDPDLAQALLAHANPDEQAILQQAISAGKPLSKLPYTKAQLADIGKTMVQRPGLFSGMVHYTMGGAGLGAFLHTMGMPGTEIASTIILGRMGLRAMDAALSSNASRAALRGLARVVPGDPTAQTLVRGAATALLGR